MANSIPSLRRMLLPICLVAVHAASLTGRAETVAPLSSVRVETGDLGMVVSDSASASRIGRQVLQQGGSAVDAAVATAFALAVSWPDAGNIGGGGFMLVRPADGIDPVCIDYRETAPASMHSRSFRKGDTTFTRKAVGVPGTVRGLATAHARYGRLPWRDLVMPAARLAVDGVPVDEALADSLNSVLSEPRVLHEPAFAELRRVYGRADGTPWQSGQRMRLPELAATLTSIAEGGPDAFYSGDVARMIVAEMQRGDGMIEIKDLADYQAVVRPVIRGQYRGYTILGAPPPSSGGICVVQALNILENFDLASRDRFDPVTIHLIAEASRRAFADRARFLGDPDFVQIPSHLTEKTYARQLASTINPAQASSSASVAPEIEMAEESPETTHFSVVDAQGMAVSNTYTLEASWGSRIVVQGAGFVLNNEMGDFNWFPGETTNRGQIGTEANTVAGRKRMLSSQSPTIVEKNGQLVLVTGSPGGRTIINTVLCILINLIDFQQAPAQAVSNDRMHHQWFPDRIELEAITRSPHADVTEALARLGHTTTGRTHQGSAHSIALDPVSKRRIGVADFRRGGRAAALDSHSVDTWEFAEAEGTPLNEATNSSGPANAWSATIPATIPHAVTDGRDGLRIQFVSPTDGETLEPRTSTIPLPNQASSSTVEIVVESASVHHASDSRVVFSFVGGGSPDGIIASASIERTKDQSIAIVAGTNREKIASVSLSDDLEIRQPLVIRLSVDHVNRVFELASRPTGADTFTSLGTAPLGASEPPLRFQITVEGENSRSDDQVTLDRIEVLASGHLEPDRSR